MGQREEVSRLLTHKFTLTAIAQQLSVDKSTISREVRRNGLTADSYRAHKAHWHALRQKQHSGRFRKLAVNSQLRGFVMAKLKLRWSPEQIAQELKKLYPDDMNQQISHEAIYTYLYVLPRGSLKKELLSYLRQQRQHRRKRRKTVKLDHNRGKIPDMISIEERPKQVAKRTIPGHWEGDLIMGKYKRSALGSLVERTTRTVILVPLKAKDAISVRQAFAQEVKKIPTQMRLSLTYDQGREMAQHKLFTKQTNMVVYFAHPAHPWERGTNENTNMLIRQFFPKGTDFNKVTRREIKHVQYLLNGRPRKVLNWLKPYEVFNELINKNVAIDS